MPDKVYVVYVVRWALSRGILEVSAPQWMDSGRLRVYLSGCVHFLSPPDWVPTIQEARTYADELRRKKINSLVRQCMRLETLRIEVRDLADVS